MPPVGFEPAIPASARPQTHALDRAATGTGPGNTQAVYLLSFNLIPKNVRLKLKSKLSLYTP
jgi:hypothetical protein